MYTSIHRWFIKLHQKLTTQVQRTSIHCWSSAGLFLTHSCHYSPYIQDHCLIEFFQYKCSQRENWQFSFWNELCLDIQRIPLSCFWFPHEYFGNLRINSARNSPSMHEIDFSFIWFPLTVIQYCNVCIFGLMFNIHCSFLISWYLLELESIDRYQSFSVCFHSCSVVASPLFTDGGIIAL